MRKLVACLFAAAAMGAAPMPSLADTNVAVVCGPGVPEAWTRPGGYCEKINGGGSLSTFVDGCEVLVTTRPIEFGEGVLVAALDGEEMPMLLAATDPCDQIEPPPCDIGMLGIDIMDMDRLVLVGC